MSGEPFLQRKKNKRRRIDLGINWKKRNRKKGC